VTSGDTNPHTLVGGAQTTLTARASVRVDRRNDPSEAWRPQGDTQSRPPEALDRCAGVTGAVGTARNTRHHSWSSILDYDSERVKQNSGVLNDDFNNTIDKLQFRINSFMTSFFFGSRFKTIP
jgi:hypothetical protein